MNEKNTHASIKRIGCNSSVRKIVYKFMDTVKGTEFKNMLKNTSEKCVDKVNSEVRISHQELVKLTRAAIADLIENDPLLSGLPADITIEELKSQIAVAQGQAITLFLNRGELPKLAVVVTYPL